MSNQIRKEAYQSTGPILEAKLVHPNCEQSKKCCIAPLDQLFAGFWFYQQNSNLPCQFIGKVKIYSEHVFWFGDTALVDREQLLGFAIVENGIFEPISLLQFYKLIITKTNQATLTLPRFSSKPPIELNNLR
ncbi:hypothetical protein HC766_00705 [Candidatus Gracilibacteria bacterium]|nr:hypothetical protein [Thermales bacterium]NJL96211.1 hypothetical protein [Candidatus Gracilibacteria bacterium]NJS40907.1 hypothetical protein [Candidatus Gracilibacteria bacterium]